ncbi:hypothetical protein PW209_000755 [Serratia marcescens]|nr:hypothetical protein [Serratia marcescens]
MHTPEFIFMLTRNDSTVPDAQARLPEVLAAGVKHIGFKDIGLPLDQLKQLAQAIHAGGATAYLEVVSLDEESEMNSARAALELGVDVLMGGTRPESVLHIFIADPSLPLIDQPSIPGHSTTISEPASVNSTLAMA